MTSSAIAITWSVLAVRNQGNFLAGTSTIFRVAGTIRPKSGGHFGGPGVVRPIEGKGTYQGLITNSAVCVALPSAAVRDASAVRGASHVMIERSLTIARRESTFTSGPIYVIDQFSAVNSHIPVQLGEALSGIPSGPL